MFNVALCSTRPQASFTTPTAKDSDHAASGALRKADIVSLFARGVSAVPPSMTSLFGSRSGYYSLTRLELSRRAHGARPSGHFMVDSLRRVVARPTMTSGLCRAKHVATFNSIYEKNSASDVSETSITTDTADPLLHKEIAEHMLCRR